MIKILFLTFSTVTCSSGCLCSSSNDVLLPISNDTRCTFYSYKKVIPFGLLHIKIISSYYQLQSHADVASKYKLATKTSKRQYFVVFSFFPKIYISMRAYVTVFILIYGRQKRLLVNYLLIN